MLLCPRLFPKPQSVTRGDVAAVGLGLLSKARTRQGAPPGVRGLVRV